jgi:plastocyanin
MQQVRHTRTFKFVAAAATAAIAAAMVAVSIPAASAAPKTVTITTSGKTFSPASVTTVVVGDTISFTGMGSHNAHATTLPAGAAPFTLGPGSGAFTYTVTVAGVYKYQCDFHLPGMVASFTAVAAGAGTTPTTPATTVPTTGGSTPTTPAAAATTMPDMPATTSAPEPAAATTAAPAPAAPAAGAAAVTHKIVTVGKTFSPKALDVKVGDTISITGLSSHPTKSDVFPAGAAPIAMTTSDITYKVTVPGKYTYLCIAHPGMNGSFTATGAAAPGGAAVPPAAGAAPAGSQVGSIPVGGVQTGGGSTAGFQQTGPMALGLALLIAAFMSAGLGRRFARNS